MLNHVWICTRLVVVMSIRWRLIALIFYHLANIILRSFPLQVALKLGKVILTRGWLLLLSGIWGGHCSFQGCNVDSKLVAVVASCALGFLLGFLLVEVLVLPVVRHLINF